MILAFEVNMYETAILKEEKNNLDLKIYVIKWDCSLKWQEEQE